VSGAIYGKGKFTDKYGEVQAGNWVNGVRKD